MKQFFHKHHYTSFLPIIFLVILESLIFLTNYLPGTSLVGWDQVSPEFDPALNFGRAIASTWQSYRGLGVLDGMSHAANLTHTLFIWLLSLFLPQTLLRFSFIHFTHLLGGIGMFFLIKRILSQKHEQKNESSFVNTQDNNVLTTLGSMAGALFYMLNLGIIQLYHAPLEVFAIHFAALPLLTLQSLRSLDKPSLKNLLFLFILSLLFSPQAFVPTVFIVFCLLFGSLLLFSFIRTRNLKTILLVAVTFLLANAFWLLPYGYSALHTPDVIRGSKINQIASEEIFYRNKAHGNLLDVFSLKGFMLSTVEYDVTSQKDVYFMQRWISHSSSFLYSLCFFVLFSSMLVGIVISSKRKDHLLYPFLATYLIGLLVLANNTPVLEQLNTFFRATFPLLGEAFRFPFTKFMTVFAFCYSIFFAIGITYLLQRFSLFRAHISIILVCIGIYLAFPIFQGYFTSPLLRLPIPDAYQQTFTYFQQQDANQRIALLPVHTFWNWQYRSWNYRGSDFLWYGLPQPILERAFDPWSLTNEQYFNEIAAAMNKRDAEALRKVLKKYTISYVLLDKTMLNTLSRQPIDFPSMEQFLTTEGGLTKEQDFGALVVYRVPKVDTLVSETPLTQVTRIPNENLQGQSIGVEAVTQSYMTSESPNLLPLFPSLSTEKLQDDLQFGLEEKQYSFILKPNSSSYKLSQPQIFTAPSLFSNEFLVPVEIQRVTGGLSITPLYPNIRINGHSIPLTTEPILLKLNGIKNPQLITMVDTGHIIPFAEGKAKTYLLNPFKNTFKISDGSHTEIISLDTATIAHKPFTVTLPNEPITSVEGEFTKISSPFEYADLIKNHDYTTREIKPVLPSVQGERIATISKQKDSVTIAARNTNAELAFYMDNLYHQASYLLTVQTDYQGGLPVHFYVDNPTQKRAELETVLSKDTTENILILPKTENYFNGYGLHFTVESMGPETAKTTFKDISIYPFPQETLSRMMISGGTTPPVTGTTQTKAVVSTQLTSSSYLTALPKEASLITLSQSYDSGWKAYLVPKSAEGLATTLTNLVPFIVGNELKTHTKVHNWANGWTVNEEAVKDLGNKRLLIVYLPQYLQYIGLAITLLSGTILIVLAARRRG